MAKDFSRAFYHSAQWQRARANAWARDHGLCQRCLERGHITPADVVHHIEELTPENVSDPRISSDPDNLVCLCHECHSGSLPPVPAWRSTPRGTSSGSTSTDSEC